MNADSQAGEAQIEGRLALAVRVITIVASLVFVTLALHDAFVKGGADGFGWFHAGLLAVGLAIGAFCFAPRAWNALALTVIVFVGLTLAAAELVLRVTLGPQFYKVYQLDDRVLYRLIPGAKRATTLPLVNGGATIRYQINSHGFRGKEFAPSADSLRIVVYGDSFIQGDFSQTENTFTERLGVHLAARMGRNAEVLNAGVAGYGPDQELRRMETELAILKPKLAVVAIYAGNDFGDLVRNKLYRLSNNGSLIENPLVALDSKFARDIARNRDETILRKMSQNVRTRLFGGRDQAYATGQEVRRERVRANLTQALSEYRAYIVEGDNVVHELYSDPYNADVSLAPESDSARYKVAMMEQIIIRMREVAAAQQVPLLLILIPSPIDAADVHETGEVDPKQFPAYRRTALTDTLEQICRRNKIPVVNLFDPFWEQRARDLYLKSGDDHWNERGQDLAAEIVSHFVTAEGLLRARPQDLTISASDRN
jgi:hypothetical protein